MIKSAGNVSGFRLGRTVYKRTSVLSCLLLGAFLSCACIMATVGMQFIRTYSHAFTPYLKWQDALVALCSFIVLDSLWGCVLIIRFLWTLRVGYRQEMLTVSEDALTVRDLAPQNLASIFWMVGTWLSCFVALLVGLIPEMLIGWTLQLAHPVLATFATIAAIALSVVALAVMLPALSFVIIGGFGGVSFWRNIGAPHVYQLTGQASLSIEGFVLTIMYPDAPESMLDLNTLDPEDRRYLLHLLRERWNGAQDLWNPRLGDEIEAALAVTEAAVLA
jgi:hypothetical protein